MYGDDFEYLDEDEKKAYNERYLGSLNEHLKQEDEEDRESIYQELRVLKYNPTSEPEQDSELNFLKAKRQAASKKKRLTGAAANYAKYLASRDGLSLKEAEKKARSLMGKEGD